MKYLEEYFDRKLEEGRIGGVTGAILGSLTARKAHQEITGMPYAPLVVKLLGAYVGWNLGDYVEERLKELLTDCSKSKNKDNPTCVKKAYKQIIDESKEALKKCSETKNPDDCQKKLNEKIVEYTTKLKDM